MRFWLVNGLVHTAIKNEVLNCDILVENGKIAAIGKCDDSAEKVDVKGKHIYPGLVEAHCHLGLEGFGFRYDEADYNELNDAVTPELNAIDAYNPLCPSVENARKAGVTTVGTGPGSSDVIGGTFMAVKTYGNCVDEMVIKSPVAMKAALGENPRKRYQDKQISSRMT